MLTGWDREEMEKVDLEVAVQPNRPRRSESDGRRDGSHISALGGGPLQALERDLAMFREGMTMLDTTAASLGANAPAQSCS